MINKKTEIVSEIIKNMTSNDKLDVTDQDNLVIFAAGICKTLFIQYYMNAEVPGADFKNQRIYAYSFTNAIHRAILDMIAESEELNND